MIYAIGIYRTNEECNQFTKLDSTPADKSSFFSSFKPLADLEKNSLPRLGEKLQNEINIEDLVNRVKKKDEYHYFKKLKDQDIVLAFSSRHEYSRKELYYLFLNINNVRIKKTKIPLEEIRLNPNNYLGKETIFIEIDDKLKTVKGIAHQNIKMAIADVEILEVLDEKAIKLEDQSKQFLKSAKKVKGCCNI